MKFFETFTILVYIIDEKNFWCGRKWFRHLTQVTHVKTTRLISLAPVSLSNATQGRYVFRRLTYNSETPKDDNFYQPNQRQNHFPFNFYLNQENTNRFHLLFFCCYLFTFFDFFKRRFHNIEWGRKWQGLSTEKICAARCERGRFVLIFWVKAVQKNVKFIRNLKECKQFHWYHHYQNNCLCYKQFVLF